MKKPIQTIAYEFADGLQKLYKIKVFRLFKYNGVRFMKFGFIMNVK